MHTTELPIWYSSCLHNDMINAGEGREDVAQKSHSLSQHHQILLFIITCLFTFLPKAMEQSHF